MRVPNAVPIANATGVSVGTGISCATIADGSVSCWGGNNVEQFARWDGPVNASAPVALGNTAGLSLKRVVLGQDAGFVLDDQGRIHAWGANYRTSGDADKNPANGMLMPAFSGGGVLRASMASRQACAVRSDGSVWCWGDGGLGDGVTSSSSATPVRVTGLPDPATDLIVDIAGRNEGTCALTRGGEVYCWGMYCNGTSCSSNTGSQWNVSGSASAAHLPSLSRSVGLVGGDGVLCAINGKGGFSCWGVNAHGQLGRSTLGAFDNVPGEAPAARGARTLAVSGAATCAGFADGTVSCWGLNTVGQLGRGTLGAAQSTSATVTGLVLERRRSCNAMSAIPSP